MSARKRIISAILVVAILLLSACSVVEDVAPEIVDDDFEEVEVIEEIGDDFEEVEVIEEIGDETEAEEPEPVSLEDFIEDALQTHSDGIRGVALTAFTRDDIILEL